MAYQPQIVFNIDKKSLKIPKRFQNRDVRVLSFEPFDYCLRSLISENKVFYMMTIS